MNADADIKLACGHTLYATIDQAHNLFLTFNDPFPCPYCGSRQRLESVEVHIPKKPLPVKALRELRKKARERRP